MNAPQTRHCQVNSALITAIGLFYECGIVRRRMVTHVRHAGVDADGKGILSYKIGSGGLGALLRDVGADAVRAGLPFIGVYQRQVIGVVAYLERLQPHLSVGQSIYHNIFFLDTARLAQYQCVI